MSGKAASAMAVDPPDLEEAQVLGGTNGPVVEEGQMGACINSMELGKSWDHTGKGSGGTGGTGGRVASRIGPWA